MRRPLNADYYVDWENGGESQSSQTSHPLESSTVVESFRQIQNSIIRFIPGRHLAIYSINQLNRTKPIALLESPEIPRELKAEN